MRETAEEKTQEDQYRQKLEDVFSGQEPIAKISEDVNSSALLFLFSSPRMTLRAARGT